MPVSGFIRAAVPSRPADPVPPLTLADLKLALRVDDDSTDAQLTRNLAAATALANRQAPAAPEAIRAEAIVRVVGWLFDGRETESVSLPGIWTRSGAKALLSPWQVRRAGIVKEAD